MNYNMYGLFLQWVISLITPESITFRLWGNIFYGLLPKRKFL